MPHAHCYLFNRKLIALHGGSDFFIGLSYVAISITLTYLAFRSRRELPFHWMMLAFALFIVACGGTHFMEVWTLQASQPPYWFSGWVKLLTAIASVTTAILLPPLVPRIRAVLQAAHRSAAQTQELEAANRDLKALNAEITDARDLLRNELDSQSKTLAQLATEVSVRARELENAKEEAEAANRAKDQFLAVLSHELRTPLTPALAAASNLTSETDLPPEQLSESLALIRRNIELEARLVDDLLDLTRIRKGKLQIHAGTINLHETIRHAADMCQSEAHNYRTELILSLDAAEFYVNGDAARLAQIVWNLILNALKFTPSGGRVQVVTRNPQSGAVQIVVIDNGIGIEQKMLSRIFEPFQQGQEGTTRRFGGLGLGLSVAKGLVDAHDGTIRAESAGVDRGATFTIELATVTPPDAPSPSISTDAPAHARRELRILLVEDHEDTRLVLSRMLTHWGHHVTVADTVAKALAEAAAVRPELLISDIGLPDGTGMDLLRQLRVHGDLLAIAMSGYGMEADLAASKDAGFMSHLVKPVAADRLREVIHRLADFGENNSPKSVSAK